jgi:superfamily I DNA/RNA helicase
MQECRRCPTDLVGIANSLIAHNKERQGRKLVGIVENGQGDIKYQQFPNFDDEVASIATNVEALISDGYKASDIIILCPRKKLARLIIDALEQKKIPVRSYFAEASLRDKVEVQEKMALLKLFLDNEDRVSLRWLLGRRISKFSPGPYARIRQECEANSISPWQCMEELSAGVRSLPRIRRQIDEFNLIKQQIAELAADPLNGSLAEVIDTLFPTDDEDFSDIRDLALTALGEEGEHNKSAFLRELVNSVVKTEVPSESGEVRIMSIHKSKGLSSPAVFISACVQGLLPKLSDGDTEEQRRLLFVGITRVKSIVNESRPGVVRISSFRSMGNGFAKQLGITPARTTAGMASFNASNFLAELGLRDDQKL